MKDYGRQLHYLAGFLAGIPLRFLPARWATAAIQRLDRFGWEREWAQNLKGKDVNDPMSPKQLAEGASWGRGARASSGVSPPFPSPPYPEGFA